MTESQKSLGELELEVLNEIWEHPGTSVLSVTKELAARRGCARTTILTVMQRLHAKGFLRRRKVDGIYLYWPTRGKGAVVSGLIKQFIDNVLSGSPAPFLAYLAQTNDLTAEGKAQLQSLIEELKQHEDQR